MEQKTIELTCRSCGKTVQIPEELTEFSCVYCGEKMTMEEFRPKPAVVGERDETDREFVLAHLIDALTGHTDFFKNFNRKHYDEYFDAFTRDIRPIYETMDRYVQACEDKQTPIREFVDRFLDDREAFHQKNKLYKVRKNALLMESKLLIALCLIPAVRRMELSVSEPFAEKLHEEYIARYPQDKFEVIDYETVSSGFGSRKLCFITTAVCEFEGKPDDCTELQAFRAFRDGWLSQSSDGRALVEEYYRIAPPIVMVIDYCDDRAAVYGEIRKNYLAPCYAALGRKDYAACKETYVRMVRDLQKRYNLN